MKANVAHHILKHDRKPEIEVIVDATQITDHTAAGFVLMEFLIALVITSVGLFGIMTVFAKSISTNVDSRELTVATILAEQRIEELKRKSGTTAGFKAITTSSLPVEKPAPGHPQYTVSTLVKQDLGVSAISSFPSPKNVLVTVYWENKARKLEMRTVLGL